MASLMGNTEQTAASAAKNLVHHVVWSATALDQLDAIGNYVEQFNPRAAADLSAHLLAAGNNLQNFPHRGRLVPGTEMRELTTDYPYIIRYRIARDVVRILRVRHTSRRPTNYAVTGAVP